MGDLQVQDTGYLTILSIYGEYTSDTFSETTQSFSNDLRGVPSGRSGRVLERGQRPLESILVARFFDLPPGLASTVAAF